MSSASSRRGKRASVKSESTLVRRRLKGGKWYAVGADGTERRLPDKAADWSRLDAMTDAQKLAAARGDPDAQPSSEAQLKRMRRVPFAKHVRWTLGLSQQEFADIFGIPIGTLRDWEQGRFEPDQAAQSYLKVIARNPKAVRKALEPA
jgi:putative transcriptional regulator